MVSACPADFGCHDAALVLVCWHARLTARSICGIDPRGLPSMSLFLSAPRGRDCQSTRCLPRTVASLVAAATMAATLVGVTAVPSRADDGFAAATVTTLAGDGSS